jgi:pimeloyl-ACP methyl ester carboxylesterase
VNNIRTHWVELGSGPAVVLVHGFPETWYARRHQIRQTLALWVTTSSWWAA